MSQGVRDGEFDVVVAAGPRVSHWPSVGIRALSATCAEMGLTVGLFGGDTLKPRGLIPLPGTGGLVLVEDIQGRVHRIRGRAVVCLRPVGELPDPFQGWWSEGLVPLSSALKLRAEGHVGWNPATLILGTGNRALQFGSEIRERYGCEVTCVETWAQWGAKRFAAWEVARRRFEALGGRVIEAKPLSLTRKGALLWDMRLQDLQGVRVMEVARVVSAGPFRVSSGVREYPPGSFLYELEQTAPQDRIEDLEGWALEEERGRALGAKIVKTLVTELGDRREELEKVQRRSRTRLKKFFRHREEPFTPVYQGKWIHASDAKRIRNFTGVPQHAHKTRPVASIECFENIPCNRCELVCPESAIKITEQQLVETDCTACGLCLSACPSAVPILIHEREEHSLSLLTFSWRGSRHWKVGELASLVNRRGETLASGRVVSLGDGTTIGSQQIQVEVPTHLAWEARGIRFQKNDGQEQEELILQSLSSRLEGRAELTLNGERRFVRDKLQLSLGLIEIGQGRAGDMLLCPDGSCGMCQVSVDGKTKLACQTETHKGMVVKVGSPAPDVSSSLCPCLAISKQQILEKIRQGRLRSPEAVLAATHIGEGRCHGQVCLDSFKRLLMDEGIEAESWIDWRFPWEEWVMSGPT